MAASGISRLQVGDVRVEGTPLPRLALPNPSLEVLRRANEFRKKKTGGAVVVYLFCSDDQGEAKLLEVQNWKPHFYLRLPKATKRRHIPSIRELMKLVCGRGAVGNVEIVLEKKFNAVGFECDWSGKPLKHTFAKLSFECMSFYRAAKRAFRPTKHGFRDRRKEERLLPALEKLELPEKGDFTERLDTWTTAHDVSITPALHG